MAGARADADIMTAAGKARPPEPVGMQSGWFPIDSYPPGARRANEQGRVGVAVRIDPSGRATACSVGVSSAAASLGRVTCELAVHDGRFTLAAGCGFPDD